MQVGTIGVIGAGVMGNGIAQIAAAKGIDVILLDVNEEAVKKGIDAVEGRLGRVVAKGQMSPAEKEAAVRRIRPTTAYESLKPADVIIEAATEDYGLKTRIFKQVDALVSADSIVASNTSSVSITKLAASMSRPERFVGLHFFNPVPVMS
ncbi:MAG: 3-hydroxyacyl-CoA dehydrogenase NAD-binding domain-containing protein, partial [Pseudolabrys sp.]